MFACDRSYYQDIPARIKPYLHYYNTFAWPTLDHSDCPLFHVREVVHPEDYVVFKLDIDNTPIEEAMVKTLLENPDILELIDEFFWEHHVNFKPMFPGWGGRGDRFVIGRAVSCVLEVCSRGVFSL